MTKPGSPRQKVKWERKHPGETWPGYTRSLETRQKISISREGEKNPMFGKPGTMLGKITPKETREKQRAASSGENNPMFGKPCYWEGKSSPMLGKHHREETKEKQSKANKGENSPMFGKHLTEITKQKIGLLNKGKPSPTKGKSTPQEVRKKQSMTKQGITDPEEWEGFSKEKRYCDKWYDPKLKIRKRVRAWWGNKCANCGATVANKRHRFLHVNHIGNDKRACCKDNPKGWLFVPLCTSCHGLSGGKNQEAADQKYTELIMTKYSGKCYYTLEEYESLVAAGILNTEDYGRRDGR
jgi:hypothetical protein